MIIKYVKFYQGVRLGTNSACASVAKDSNVDYQGKNTVSLEETNHGILIKYGSRATLATWNNIQYVEYEQDIKQEKEEPKKNLDAALKRQKD